MFRRKGSTNPSTRDFPPELLAEASRHPNGYVYDIDPRFDSDGAIPPHAIKGAWVVGTDGKPTGEYEANARFGLRAPLSEVAQIVADLKANTGGQELEVFVADDLRVNGEPVPFDVGIAIVMDTALGEGYFPTVEPWMFDIEDGRRYVLHRGELAGKS